MSNGGKGSSPRPYSVSQEEFANNWDAIFGKKKKSDHEKDAKIPTDDQLKQLNNSVKNDEV